MMGRDLAGVVVYISPQHRCDVVPFAFYRQTSGILLDVRHRAVDNYSADHGLDLLHSAGPDLVSDPATRQVVIAGSAFSFGLTWDELEHELSATSDRVGVPVITDMVPTVHQLRSLNSPTVVTHRLAGVSEEAIRRFLGSAGIEVAGVVSRPRTAADNASTPLAAGAEEAAKLCRLALEQHPDAPVVTLLGGSFLTGPARLLVEQSGRELVNNLDAFVSQFSDSAALTKRTTQAVNS